ncbi:hypothetical protein D3C84_907970 [compost metagenome]
MCFKLSDKASLVFAIFTSGYFQAGITIVAQALFVFTLTAFVGDSDGIVRVALHAANSPDCGAIGGVRYRFGERLLRILPGTETRFECFQNQLAYLTTGNAVQVLAGLLGGLFVG